MTTTIERAIAYVRAMPPALAGSRGHPATFAVAVALVRGFQLAPETALEILTDVHNPTCCPPWSAKELRHKIESAARDSTREPGYLLDATDRRNQEARCVADEARPERIDQSTYHNVATALRELCGDFTDHPEVVQYLDQRCLIAAAAKAGVFGLPPRDVQATMIDALRQRFEDESLAKAGLLWRDRGGKIDGRSLAYGDHRLCISWLAPDGRVDVIQRRRLGPGDRPYVFPTGMRPRYPFGIERLKRASEEATIAFCEGALDVMALRLIVRRDNLDVIPLGLPGVDGWRPEWARYARGRRALVALDADHAGDEAAEKVAMDLVATGATSVERWRPPEKDWAASLPGAGS